MKKKLKQPIKKRNEADCHKFSHIFFWLNEMRLRPWNLIINIWRIKYCLLHFSSSSIFIFIFYLFPLKGFNRNWSAKIKQIIIIIIKKGYKFSYLLPFFYLA